MSGIVAQLFKVFKQNYIRLGGDIFEKLKPFEISWREKQNFRFS